MENTPVLSFAQYLETGKLDTKFDTDVSDKMLLIAASARVTALTVSELLRENQ